MDRFPGERVERFNAEGPDGLISRKPPGSPSRLDGARRAELVRIVESGPIPARDGVVLWRPIDLAARIREGEARARHRSERRAERPRLRLDHV